MGERDEVAFQRRSSDKFMNLKFPHPWIRVRRILRLPCRKEWRGIQARLRIRACFCNEEGMGNVSVSNTQLL